MSQQLSDVEMQNLLDAITQGMMHEQLDSEATLRRYDVHRDMITPYVRLVERLHHALQPQQPSEPFMRDLKHDLIGQPRRSIVNMNGLPIRAQIAAAAAAIAAGFLLILRRRNMAEVAEALDVPVLQQ